MRAPGLIVSPRRSSLARNASARSTTSSHSTTLIAVAEQRAALAPAHEAALPEVLREAVRLEQRPRSPSSRRAVEEVHGRRVVVAAHDLEREVQPRTQSRCSRRDRRCHRDRRHATRAAPMLLSTRARMSSRPSCSAIRRASRPSFDRVVVPIGEHVVARDLGEHGRLDARRRPPRDERRRVLDVRRSPRDCPSRQPEVSAIISDASAAPSGSPAARKPSRASASSSSPSQRPDVSHSPSCNSRLGALGVVLRGQLERLGEVALRLRRAHSATRAIAGIAQAQSRVARSEAVDDPAPDARVSSSALA